jgi:Defence against restriction A N-terminal
MKPINKATTTETSREPNKIARTGEKLQFDFSNEVKIKKQLTDLFTQSGIEQVVDIVLNPKVRREAGYSYREIEVFLPDSQTVKFKITTDGDIYQVLVNNKLFAIKEQEDHNKAILEIAKFLLANSAKYEALKAKEKAPTPLKTPRIKQEEKLQQDIADKQNAIAKLDQDITDLDKQNSDLDKQITELAKAA